MSDIMDNEFPAYMKETVVCRCPKCHEVVPLLLILRTDTEIERI